MYNCTLEPLSYGPLIYGHPCLPGSFISHSKHVDLCVREKNLLYKKCENVAIKKIAVKALILYTQICVQKVLAGLS